MSSSKSYSQRKRDKLAYRQEYFKHNPGIFGCIWSCAYCHRPLVGKQNVQVDHIIPLNNPLGHNARYNLVAACGKCNRDKSDKFDGRVVVGYVSKILEVIVFSLQKILVIGLVAVWVVVQKLASLAVTGAVAPFRNSGICAKIVALVVIGFCAYYAIGKM